jgi:hypothetical protein
MSCNPFENLDAVVKDYDWHDGEERKIFLKDGTSHPFVAIYEGELTFNAFVVDGKLLSREYGKKMCDNLLLKCPINGNDGVAYFIEMKTNHGITKGLQQLKESYDRLKLKHNNWMSEYPVYYFRICFKSKTTNITDSSYYRALRTLVPRGFREEVVIKIDNFVDDPEVIK